MVQSDHTYAGPSTEASASSLEPGTAGVAATLSASADLSPGAPFSSSPLSYEGSFTSPINERRPLQKLRAKLRQLRNRNKRLQGLLLQRRRMKTTAELVDSLREHLTPAVASFVEAQLKMHNVSRFGRRWCSQNKTFALGLYFHSPKGYRYCRKLLKLPSVRSLQLWLARVRLRVGFYPEVFDLIEKRAASFPRQDRACTIIFDEMHVSKELSYNPVPDRFEGLEEYSAAQGPNLANKALVFMAKGICTPWKQPLGYFFADKAAPATVLYDLLFKCHKMLVGAGLQPVAVVCDQGNQNVSLFSKLVTPEKPLAQYALQATKIFAAGSVLAAGNEVPLLQMAAPVVYVTVFRLPPSVSDDALAAALSPYGKPAAGVEPLSGRPESPAEPVVPSAAESDDTSPTVAITGEPAGAIPEVVSDEEKAEKSSSPEEDSEASTSSSVPSGVTDTEIDRFHSQPTAGQRNQDDLEPESSGTPSEASAFVFPKGDPSWTNPISQVADLLHPGTQQSCSIPDTPSTASLAALQRQRSAPRLSGTRMVSKGHGIDEAKRQLSSSDGGAASAYPTVLKK
ncbi:uncharacterized protein LOC144117403 [Amblyomma americanum]